MKQSKHSILSSYSQVPTEFRKPASLNPSEETEMQNEASVSFDAQKVIHRSPNKVNYNNKQYKSTRDGIKLHFSCSDAMRQTQYNKLITTVNKFDAERIKKAIREGKIKKLIQDESNDPVVIKNFKQANQRSSNRNKQQTFDTNSEDYKIERARQNK